MFPNLLHFCGINFKSAPNPNNAGVVPMPNACIRAMPSTAPPDAALRATIAYKSPQGSSAAETPKNNGARTPDFIANFASASEIPAVPLALLTREKIITASISTPPTSETIAVALPNTPVPISTAPTVPAKIE